MSGKSLTIDQVLGLLAATPVGIASATDGLSALRLRTSPMEGEWSENEVLAHLRSCADVWGRSIATILAEDAPTIRAVNPQAWIASTDYPDLEFGPSLLAFTRQRAELLAILEPLPAMGWSRSATITGAGAPLRKTVQDFAVRLAVHERPHVKQIARVLAAVAR
jgi:hypothetical protein